ncbi:MAG: cysteine--tRNA ligase [Nanoarchaeota archaeon]|nr:cysteine--tRNA ligase [Nanoarchaeota archaeon]
MIKIYNTLSRKKEIFKPIKSGEVKIYTCGPTVYYYAHIGNFRAYVFADILRRTLEMNDYDVKQVINLTDVGHLTSDQDEGEDKIEKEAKKENKTPKQIADFYTNAFFEDFKKLNIEKPEVVCKATEHVKEMIELIKNLEKKDYAYVGENGNVYFDTSKFKKYGELARLDLKELKAGARIKVDKKKKNPRDFVLWFVEKGSKYKEHILKWKSPWGEGWPGWHIECSAMSMKYLGETFDIHTGGEDHIPVHHTNEIAQSEGATGKKFVNYWLHTSFLQFNSEKMSKSKGGILRLEDLEKEGYSPMDLRYFYLSGHYRKPLNFTFTNLKNSKNSYERLKNIISALKKSGEKINNKNIDGAKKQFLEIINDDLNSPKALSFLWDILREEKLNDSEKYKLALEFDKILGLKLDEEEKINIPKEIKKLSNERETARKKKDFVTADKIREKINKLGYVLEDTGKGVEVKKR